MKELIKPNQLEKEHAENAEAYCEMGYSICKEMLRCYVRGLYNDDEIGDNEIIF
jgi:hypothetical protein